MLYVFFWVIPRQVVVFTQPPAYEDGTECSETSPHNQTPGNNNPEESIQQIKNLFALIFCMDEKLFLFGDQFENFDAIKWYEYPTIKNYVLVMKAGNNDKFIL